MSRSPDGSCAGRSAARWLRHPVVRLVPVLVLAGAVRAAATQAGPLVPGPGWSPAEVVRIQLEALRSTGADDDGIATCFRFASPSNKRATGPIGHFARMIRQGPYALMLDYRDAVFDPVEVRGPRAVQRVTLSSATRAMSYLFVLSRQSGGDCPGCWMTDAVYVEGAVRRVT